MTTGSRTVVFGTSDGGRTWQQSGSIAASQPIAIDVIGRRGWLLESLGAAMGSNPVRVYRTTDTGQSWSSQDLPVPQSGWQQAGCVVRPVMVTTAKTVLEMEAYSDLALLLTSADAGLSWRVLEMPAGAGPYPRVQFGPSDAIAVSGGSQGSVGSTFFVTSNGGLSASAELNGTDGAGSGPLRSARGG